MSSTYSDPISASPESGPAAPPSRLAWLIDREKWSAWPQLVAIALQLMLIAGLLTTFKIDSRAFRYQFAAICVAFVVHHFLPARFQLPFFACFSMAAILSVIGGMHGAYLIGIGLALIGIVHLPAPFAARIALVAMVGAGLMVLRAGGQLPGMSGVWPILGSIFMFRLMVYMHDLKTGIAPFGLWKSLAYFFMVPNVCFPLFPLVDYKTFTRTYYNEPAIEIYQKGVDWIVRGVLQLLLYRYVYQNLLIDPKEVTDLGDLTRYLVANFGLYLRVSGNFHLIVGVLHLFGFNLSETHHKYVLSSSFTDFWRRINIYWKDFIQKLFFFPVYFRVKKRGEMFALITATAFAFFATWLLHSYQWFWLRGSWLFTWQDMTFWTILALGVLVNVVYETKNTRARAAAKMQRGWRADLKRALCTIAMFTFICLLWSLWNTESWDEWTTMLSKARYASARDLAWLLGGMFVLGVAAVTMGRSTSERTEAPRKLAPKVVNQTFWRSAAVTAALAGIVLVIGRNPLLLIAAPRVANVVTELRENRLNTSDVARLERGYYEDLIDESRFNGELADLYSTRPRDWNRERTQRDRPDRNFPNWDLTPNLKSNEFGILRSINRWGMRDRDYSLQKPAGVCRFAVLGDSNTAGNKVSDHEVFEHLIETRWNGLAPEVAGKPLELLNFGCGSYGPYCRLQVLRNRVLEFQPDAVLCVSLNDIDWIARDLARGMSRNLIVPDEFVKQTIEKAGVRPGYSEEVGEHQLKPYALDLLKWTYQQTAELCRQHGMRAYIAYLPRLDDRAWEREQLPVLKRLAEEAGFTVMDLGDAYATVEDWSTLWVRPWDSHPNAHGHQLIADKLFEQFSPHVRSEIRRLSDSP